MCLFTCPKAEKEFVKKYGKQKKIRVYKILELSSDRTRLVGPYISYYEYYPGINYSTTSVKKRPLGTYSKSRDISRGLHVYLTKNKARQGVSDGAAIVTMLADPADCVGVGEDGHAVFTKLELSNRSWLQARKNLRKYRVSLW